jgi:glycosyltransferase involved in cell wall biosynthesis
MRRDHVAEWASFPTRLVEYARYGVPIITTAVDDVSLYLKDGEHAVFLDSTSTKLAAEKLKSVLTNAPQLKMLSQRFQKLGKDKFDSNRYVRDMSDLVDSISTSNFK